ncbi:MAG: FAD-dependent oxidoreductase [Merismopedia sp. SIO2A8]|nr:FAD-dependent oxidoreductase [Merismopedia sp. SIO2A8]
MQDADVIVIGSGIGGLVAGALLARYGKRVIVCESHGIPGGAAHSFSRKGFHFDSGPSFYCGLGNIGTGANRPSLNPLRQVLDVLEQPLETIPYDPLGHYYFPDATLPIYGNAEQYREAIATITPQGAKELAQLESKLLGLYQALKGIPTLAIRPDLRGIPILFQRYPWAMAKMLPYLGVVQGPVSRWADQTIHDPWVRRLLDVECFLLSGLKANGTVTPEIAFMFGERSESVVDYPLGGSGAIIKALVNGLQQWGGTLRLGTHVEKIIVKQNRAVGVQLRQGESLSAPVVISNATLWDTCNHLLSPGDLPSRYRQTALETPVVESFMHLHLGIRAEGLDGLTGHHVVIRDENQDIAIPGNTCMISIPSVWDETLAPPGHHLIHAYTLESYQGWVRDDSYEDHKRERAQSLFSALARVIPDIRDRMTLELIGTPLTHAHYLRRHQGTYGPAIAAGQGMFPSHKTPITGLYRVGDSTVPGIGVPAVAASGILCANSLVKPEQTVELLDKLGI